MKFVKNNRIISGQLQNNLVMLDINAGKYFSLNPVATRIWQILEEPISVDELCLHLMDEFEVEPDQCRTEVEEHLREMVKLGLIAKHEA